MMTLQRNPFWCRQNSRELIFRDEIKQRFSLKGLEVQHPPEYEAERTIMVKNVDSTISAMSEAQILEHISRDFKVKRVI